MLNPVWQDALKNCADAPRGRRWLEKLLATSAGPRLQTASASQARILAALFSGSEVLAELLMNHPEWFDSAGLEPDYLRHPRQKQGLQREVRAWLDRLIEAQEFEAALARLRQFKQREMLRIATRDLAHLGAVQEIVLELSNVADVCLEGVYQILERQFAERLGRPWHTDAQGAWQPTQFSVIGLGKLGGQELNYSSDVDVIFLYSDEGHVCRARPGPPEMPSVHGLSNHRYFTRLAEAFIAEVARLTPDGRLYRIDLRLRPEGDAGLLVRSVAGYENYYAQWGQTWERMMLIKARGVAGDSALTADFLEMIQAFRFPRSLAERALSEVAVMKDRLEREVLKGDEVERNVKLGRGGIREIEFVVQTLQLVHAGRLPFLQTPHTLPALAKLVQYGCLTAEQSNALNRAYSFLRSLEHRLQMEANLQTHNLPTDRRAKERLARLMGFDSLAGFEATLRDHRQRVRDVYDQLFRARPPAPTQVLPAEFAGAEPEWKRLLEPHGFRDPAQATRLLELFVHGPGYIHVSNRTVELARDLVVHLLALCPPRESPPNQQPLPPAHPSVGDAPLLPAPELRGAKILSDPDRVLTRLDSFIGAYGARATLFEMWASKPTLFELLLLLFDRSEFLAEIAIRVPDLVDDLELSGRLRRAKTAEETLKDLRHGSSDADQRLWIRRYHQAEFMRIGLRDILGLADEEQSLLELSALAEACLQYALEVSLRAQGIQTCPLVIIGLGKLGGAELTYGSDLDLLFVAQPSLKRLAPLQSVAANVMDLLSSQTESGVAFATDARLRPDGAKGLLVNTLRAYEDYYRGRAQLWEIQSLVRSRPIAGNRELGQRFQKLAVALTDFSKPCLPLAAHTPNWRETIAKMRQRIEKERVPPGQEALAFKTGAGGLIDAEFIAQTLCLAHGWHEPSTLGALERGRVAGVLPDADALIENFRKLRRLECILRRWSYAGEAELPSDPAPLYRVAVRCGFPDAAALMQSVGAYRQAIRAVYNQLLP